jgi:hypothetical protein
VSAAQDLAYLSAVPPLDNTSWRMALLLRARRGAERAYDAARAVPRAAAGFAARLMRTEQLQEPLELLRRLSKRLRPLAQPLIRRMSGNDALAAVGLLLTSDTVRGLASRLGHLTLNVATWAATTAGRLLDGALRRCGAPGTATADFLCRSASKAGRSASECAAPLFRVLVRTSLATEGLRSVVGGFVRGYALHRVLRLLIGNRLLRAFVAAVVVPVVAESRLLVWTRDLAEQVQCRLRRLQSRAEQSTRTPQQEQAMPEQPRQQERQPEVPEQPVTEPAPGSADAPVASEPSSAEQKAEPANRAERRAMQQQQARNRRKPKAA